MPPTPTAPKFDSIDTKRIAALEQQLKNWEAWGKKAKARIAALEALVHEVKDHVDPAKKDVEMAVTQAKKWVSRAVKVLKSIF